ncbi:MAG TPA: hypothetical protein VMU39_04150 [Solirubrobacteraceae bacterium]|nr:hypothetical protein [Solirubrobacteraceae bacterium]
MAVIVWAAAVAAAVALSNAVASSVHTSTSAGASGTAGASFDASAVTATDSDSLFRTANLTKVLAIARSHLGAGAHVEEVVIYPGYLDTSAVRPGGVLEVYLNAVGAYEPTSTPANPGDTALLPLARVKADAPAAIAQRIATDAHVPESQLRYMIAELDPVSHRFHWLVYTTPGSSVEYFELAGPTAPLYELRANSSTGLQRVRG